MATNVTESDFKQVLADALSGLKGIGQNAVQQIANEYAPRLAALAVSDDPAAERDDIMVNLQLAGDILGVEAESVVGQAVASVLRAATGVALKFATAALA